MTPSKADLELRVERNTNDIASIYDILTEHGMELKAIRSTLAEHGAQLTEILKRLPPAA